MLAEANAVFGPERMQSVAVIEEDQWCEVKGLSVTVTTKKAHEKVLLASQPQPGCMFFD